jgi:hypothetical protein
MPKGCPKSCLSHASKAIGGGVMFGIADFGTKKYRKYTESGASLVIVFRKKYSQNKKL